MAREGGDHRGKDLRPMAQRRDRNLKYFYYKVSQRRKKNIIKGLETVKVDG